MIEAGANKERVEAFITKHAITVANGEETTSEIILTEALMEEAVASGLITIENVKAILSKNGIIKTDIKETASKEALIRALRKETAARTALIAKLALLAAAIYAVYKVYDYFIETSSEASTRLENAVEKTTSKYDKLESSIQDINTQLEENKKRIDEINSLESPTYVENEELDKLKEVNAYLKENKELLEDSEAAYSQDAVSAIYEKFKTEFYTNKTKKLSDVEDEDWINDVGKIPGVKQIMGYIVTSTDEYATDAEKLDSYIDKIKELKNAQDELIQSGNDTIYLNKDSIFGKELSYEDISNGINSITEEIEAYRTQILLTLNEISKYDPTFSTDEAKNIIEILDRIEFAIDVDEFGKNITNRISESTEFSDISQSISDKIKEGILTEDNLITDEESKLLIQKIAEEMVKAEGSVEFSSFKYKHFGETYLEDYEQQIKEQAKNSVYIKRAASYIVEKFREEIANASKESNIISQSTIIDSVEQIKNELATAFKELGTAYSEIFNIDSDTAEINFSLSNVDNDMLSSIKEAFSELEGFNTTNLESFFDILTNSESTSEQVQQAFNDIATSYLLSSTTLEKLNSTTAASIVKQLEELGIVNAKELVYNTLNAKQETNNILLKNHLSTQAKFNELTYESQIQLLNEANASETCRSYIAKLQLAEINYNKVGLDVSGKISQLKNLAMAYGIVNTVAEEMANRESEARAYEKLTGASTGVKYTNADYKRAEKDFSSKIEAQFARLETFEYNGGNDYQEKLSNAQKELAEKNAEKSEQIIDWIERKVNNLTKALNNLKDASDDTYSSWSNRSAALTKAIDTTRQAIELQKQAYNRYMQQAESVGLPEIYKNLIKNGALDISVITDEDTKEKISDYQEWYDKAQDCLDVQKDLMDSLNELNSKKFDNIQSIFEFDKSNIEHSITMLNSYIDKLEMKGLFANESYYNQMLQYTQKEIDSLTNEREQLANVMNSSALSQDSEAWREMYSTLTQIDEEILELNNDVVECNNSIRDLNWEIFEYLEESINRITGETEYLIDLLSNEDLYDENGNLTKYANATLGLYATAYDTYRQQAKDYYEEVQDLQRQLVNGAGKDVLEQYNEMVDAHQEAVKSANQEKQAILDLIEDGYQKQIDHLNEIINKKKESLNAEKDLYDYQKSIEDKTKNISSLQKQYDIYKNDTSEEGISQAQKIKVSLEEAKADLKETEYDRYLQDTQDMLDELHD